MNRLHAVGPKMFALSALAAICSFTSAFSDFGAACADTLSETKAPESRSSKQRWTGGDPVESGIRYDQMLELGSVSGNTLLMQAEAALKSHHYDYAIALAKRGIKKNSDDADIRKIYAEALEEKLEQQNPQNPKLYNECVQAWLGVLRNMVGDERAMTARGVSLPVVEHFYGDEDRTIVAKQHLISLTGRSPKFWESNSKFLARTLKPVPSVEGHLVSQR